jgi:copper(I)-binding protein
MISRRTLGVSVIVIAVLPLAAACGAGRSSTTDKERQTPYVASAHVGSLFVTAAHLVPSQAASASSAATATPTPSASTSSGTGTADAYLVFTVVNKGQRPDQLNGVQVQGGSVSPADSSAAALTVAPSQVLQFVDPEFGDSGNSLRVTDLAQPLTPGTSVPVVFQFQQAGALAIRVPVKTSDSFGTTATSTPLPLTGSYPSPSEAPRPEPTGG